MNISIRKISRRLTFALAATTIMATAAQAVPVYTITDLGTLGVRGGFSEGNGINDSGQVTGWAFTNSGAMHAFISDATTNVLTDLVPLSSTNSIGHGINASGQVAGEVITGRSRRRASRAFIVDATTITYLGGLGGRNTSVGFGINASGQVTGQANVNSGAQHAFISNATTYIPTDLGTFGGLYSVGFGINDSGQATGWATTRRGAEHAFISNATTNVLTDLGSFGGGYSRGYAINASGQVSGSAWTNLGDMHAFISNATTNALTDIGTLTGDVKSEGKGINASGQVVGYSSNNRYNRAFLWDSGTMFDLNSLVAAADPLKGIFTLSSANGINSFGDIVGTGTTANGYSHAFLLTAQRAPAVGANSVPEPAPLALLGFGLLGLGFIRKRRG